MDLQLTRIFVKVVQNSSFSKAAELLKIPKSTVSKAVTALENNTGTKLLLRTTRSLTLTPAGKAFYDSCVGPIQTLEDAQRSLHGQDSIVSGLIRITAPEDLGSQVIAPTIARLGQTHPALNFELVYTDEVLDLVKEGFDLAVRIGKLTESSLKAKKIGEIVLVPVASPTYLRKKEKIRGPKDLENHDCLTLNDPNLISKWSLKNESKTALLKIKPRISSNQMTSLLNMAIAGGGIALVPKFICRQAIEDGALAYALPGWSSPGLPVHLVSPLSVSSSVKLKMTAELLFTEIRGALNSK
ncbi:LysR family transcriptional regulator [Bdellovibrio reynosensis]|uniref:LysR family transcriptional regulator n=1 Tax=Bdellovibrio reynosensis TaxID=2835041 RepID=A0ABY4CBZ2_9BACT|nr:LysR family transcriptional regulator [Bdellovibrio reynosensis]UOF02465.1 LysR family transcriptional regulator [Bdellovibrio reynosensis]